MPVDEDKLETTIKNLEIKIAEKDNETSQMRQVRKNLLDFKMKTEELQPGETEQVKTIPINVRTNKPYTTAERIKQYDDNMPRAEAFLA